MSEQERTKEKTPDRVQTRAQEILEAEEAIRKLATVIGSASERAKEEEELKARLTEATEALRQAREAVESAKETLGRVEERLNMKSDELGQRVDSVTTHLADVREDVQSRLEDGRLQLETRLTTLKAEVQKLLEGARDQIDTKVSGQLSTSVSDLKAAIDQLGARIEVAEAKTQKHFLRMNTLVRWILMVASVAGLLGAALINLVILKP